MKDFWNKLEIYYCNKGISTNQFTENNSTEVARDNMLFDFAERMLTEQEKIKGLKTKELKNDLLWLIHTNLVTAEFVIDEQIEDEEEAQETIDQILEIAFRHNITIDDAQFSRLFKVGSCEKKEFYR